MGVSISTTIFAVLRLALTYGQNSFSTSTSGQSEVKVKAEQSIEQAK